MTDKKKTVRIHHTNKCGNLSGTIKSSKATELSLKIMKAFDNACKEFNEKEEK